MKVEFLHTLDKAPWQKTEGYISLINGKIDFSHAPSDLVQVLKDGINVRGTMFFPRDGVDFMKNLPKAFNGSMFRAIIV